MGPTMDWVAPWSEVEAFKSAAVHAGRFGAALATLPNNVARTIAVATAQANLWWKIESNISELPSSIGLLVDCSAGRRSARWSRRQHTPHLPPPAKVS